MEPGQSTAPVKPSPSIMRLDAIERAIAEHLYAADVFMSRQEGMPTFHEINSGHRERYLRRARFILGHQDDLCRASALSLAIDNAMRIHDANSFDPFVADMADKIATSVLGAYNPGRAWDLAKKVRAYGEGR